MLFNLNYTLNIYLVNSIIYSSASIVIILLFEIGWKLV